MVTRNRWFSTPHGYSRQHEKRDAERLVDEDLTLEPSGNPPGGAGTGPQPHERVVLDLAPRVQLRGGIDLRAITRAGVRDGSARPAGQRPVHPLLQLAQQSGRWLGRVARQLGQRLLRLARRQGQRLLDWISWR